MPSVQEQLQELADRMVTVGSEDGLQVSVYRDGEAIADVVSGLTGRGREKVSASTPFYCASTCKAVAATVVHVLVRDGLLDYETRVAEVWPEFAAKGKDDVTVRHVLTHSTGVPSVPPGTQVDDLLDWDRMCSALADAEPWWSPGERVGYHAATFGFLVGEIVRRAADAPISVVLADRIANPLGVAEELFFGVPTHRLPDVATQNPDPVGAAMFASMPSDFPLFKAVPAAIVPNAEYANRPDILAADLPFQGTASARALARMYSALLGEVNGVRLLSEEHLRSVTRLASPDHIDEMTAGRSVWSLGYCVGWPGTSDPEKRPDMFGMVGIGGSAAWADSGRGLAVAVTKNRFNPVQMDLVQAVSEVVDDAF